MPSTTLVAEGRAARDSEQLGTVLLFQRSDPVRESQILAKDPGLESQTRASLLGHSRQRGFPVCSCQFSTNLRFYGVTLGG